MAADLDRFLSAQDGTFEIALEELRAGCKQSHWMWFILPQLRGLGRSGMSHRYGIADLDEARAYLAHPVLGPRLADCARALLSHDGVSAKEIMGPVDAGKLRSSATLFAEAGRGSTSGQLMEALLARYFAGRPCDRTLAMLG